MKLSKLLVLCAAWLGLAGSAKAGVPDGVWTLPEPQGLQFTDFEPYEHFYLYNPAAKMFFASGNEWNTRAGVATFAYEVWFYESSEEDAPEGSYEFWDNCQHPDRQLGEKNLFTDDGGSTWVDRASQGNYSWTVTKVGDSYRFQNVALIADLPEYEGTFFGWKGSYDDTRLYMINPASEGAAVDWKFVTLESYETFVASDAYQAYADGFDKYFAAQTLKAAIEAAEALWIDVTEATALYSNTSSTAADMTAAAKALNELVEVKQKLKNAIEEAEGNGYTETEAYWTVLKNPAATKTEVEQAILDLGNALVEWGKTHASVDNPADMTAKIVNPNFDNASSSGWSGSSPNMVGSGSHGPANVAETWNNTFDMYQDISDLPAGVYSLRAKTSWRGSWNDMVNGIGPAAKLYAVAGGVESSVPFNYIWACYNTESLGGSTYFGTGAGENAEEHENADGEMVTYYSPNDPSAFRLYEEKGFYDTQVLFGLTEGDVRIGVKNPAKMGDSDNWSCYDTFQLFYYGTGADAAQLYLDESIKNFSALDIEEGTLYTQAYVDAYNALFENAPAATSFEAVGEFLTSINDAKNALDKNIELWKTWKTTVESAVNDYLNDPQFQYFASIYALSDYYEGDVYIDEETGEEYPGYETIVEELALTNEELEAEIEKIKAMVQAIKDEQLRQLHEGQDCTFMLKNPGFDEDADINSGNAEGWTKDVFDNSHGGNITRGPLGQANKDLMESSLGYMNYCFESWHVSNFDVWQEVKDAPVGVYEIQVQGYVRCEVSGYQRGDDLTNYPSPIYLYMNSAKSYFPNVYSETRPINENTGEEFQYVTVESWTTEEINGYLYPNSMGGAAQCFGWGMYKVNTYGLVARATDTMRIGVKGEVPGSDNWWCIWDSFKLTYQGFKADVVKPALEAAMAAIDVSQHMGKTAYANASKAYEEAVAAIATGDGQTMFNALINVYEASDAVTTSVALFNKLNTANEELYTAITYSTASSATKNEAQTLADKISNGYENNSYEDEDVEALLEEIQKMIVKLAFPAGSENATDDNSFEVTAAIVNPTYDENTNGWKGTGVSRNADYTDVEVFGNDFDSWQEISGLLEGTYELGVQGFFRFGSSENDYTTWVENPNANNNAFLYAAYINGTDTITSSKPMIRLAAEANEQLAFGDPTDGYVYCKQPTSEEAADGLIVANTMATASQEFDMGKYQNSVIFKVGAEGKVRIGLKKNVNVENNWAIWDTWTLRYFGKNSTKQADGDASGINTVVSMPVLAVEYFTLDGRRATTAQRGIFIQKATMQDGTVVIKKVRK